MSKSIIKLDEEEVFLDLNFSNITKAEEASYNFHQFAAKIQTGGCGITQIVNVYYFLQSTAYSQEQICQKILKDGLAFHLKQITDVLLIAILKGSNNIAKEDAKKK